MSIQVGAKLPAVTVKRVSGDGLEDVKTEELFSGKKVILFSVPGAYTSTCTKTHLPGFVAKADELKSKGVDDVVCMAVNDPFVMNAWAKEIDPEGKITLLPDGNGEFAQQLGLTMDGSRVGLGTRSKRFSMIVEDGVVKSLDIEENPTQVTVSGAAHCLLSF